MTSEPLPFDLNNLRGKLCIVTGAANNGIGWGIANHAAGVLGMHVAILDLHAKPVESAAETLQQSFPEITVLGIQCDVTNPAALEQAHNSINSLLPSIKIGAVFANAGVVFHRTMAKSTLEEWSTTFNVNVLGVVNTIKAFLPRLQEENGDAVIATTASIGGLVRGDGGTGPYQASKHAVVALSESLSFELALHYPGIRVHVICPCIVSSSLRATSELNLSVARGETEGTQVEMVQASSGEFSMSPQRHAQQVFDLIEQGKFYVLTDNVRPYVDHDFPFDGLALVEKRMTDMKSLHLDNTAALDTKAKPRTATLVGPMFQEMRRRSED